MRTSSVFLFLLSAAVLAVTGCSTINSRIEEKSAVFAALPQADQLRIRQGSVAVGDSTDLVYIALGKPDVRRERYHAKTHESVWIYQSYDETYAGSAYAGYRRYVAFDRTSGRSYIVREPVYADVYRRRLDDQIRITFVDGRVTQIEQQKR